MAWFSSSTGFTVIQLTLLSFPVLVVVAAMCHVVWCSVLVVVEILGILLVVPDIRVDVFFSRFFSFCFVPYASSVVLGCVFTRTMLVSGGGRFPCILILPCTLRVPSHVWIIDAAGITCPAAWCCAGHFAPTVNGQDADL